ncbi:MAG: hypothetical protein EAX91_02450 [Candidatus Lokiarchaeota archaeon]|nr:hypothetical protein [Candidatus Lokiarchaeota archaeon]
MDKKSVGIFLVALGVIFLGISLVTIWSMFFDYHVSNAILIILSIPLMVFSFTMILFAFYLIIKAKLSVKITGLISIIDGIIPIISSIYAMTDSRLDVINELRILVLLPLTLAGIFLVVYGVFLISADIYIDSENLKKRANQILGIIAIAIGLVNIIAFIALLVTIWELPIFLSFFWLMIGVIMVYFGIHLFTKSVEIKKKFLKKKK